MTTTISISKIEGVPPTSVTKMIDYWLCQLGHFTQVELLTAMEYLEEDQLEKDKVFISHHLIEIGK